LAFVDLRSGSNFKYSSIQYVDVESLLDEDDDV
jgi:hypothetical protein